MSEYKAVILEPRSDVAPVHPDAVGFYAMPVMANLQNTGDRIQTMVDQLGIPFVMADLLAQGKKEIFGMPAKEANQVHGDVYRDMSRRRLDFAHGELARYGASTVLGMGDSLGVPAIQGMQLHGEKDQRFNALLLRDGWNLKTEIGTARGLGRYGWYQVKDAAHGMFGGNKREVTDYGYDQQDLDDPREVSTLQTFANVADTMRGPENRQNGLKLAAKAALSHEAVLNLVCLIEGLSGSESDMALFVRDARTAYNNQARTTSSAERAHNRLRTDLVHGWHSDLLDPARGAQDVRNTLELL